MKTLNYIPDSEHAYTAEICMSYSNSTIVLKRISTKEPYQERGKEETKDNMVRQHHSVDRYGLGKNTESNGQQKSTEKDDPWCSQPSDRGTVRAPGL